MYILSEDRATKVVAMVSTAKVLRGPSQDQPRNKPFSQRLRIQCVNKNISQDKYIRVDSDGWQIYLRQIGR